MSFQPSRKMGNSIAQQFEGTAAVIARLLLVQAIRRAGFQHVLHGHPCVLGFVVGREKDLDLFMRAAARLLDIIGPKVYGAHHEAFSFSSRPRKARRNERAELISSLASSRMLFGVASTPAGFPREFHLSCDGIAVVPALNTRTLRGLFRKITGGNLANDDAAEILTLSIDDIGAILRPRRRADVALAKLKEVAANPPPDETPGATADGPSLDDLAGYGEAELWGRTLAEDMRDYRSGTITWADVDKGMLLSGPPGTGKTIFAKALARTCGLPVFAHSLAKWQAKGCLNDLLRAMHDAFGEARENSPCILFLDEIDAIGDRARMSGSNAQYCREVINAFLECLDGTDGREGVVVVGATNLPALIDPAVRRPGRLERHVEIPLPDFTSRVRIFRYHLKGELSNMEVTDAARLANGATGADIELLVRSARRRARREKRAIAESDLLSHIPVIHLTDEEIWRGCIHEAGHAAVAHLLAGELGANLTKAWMTAAQTAFTRSSGATIMQREGSLVRTKKQYLAETTMLLSGIVAEQAFFGDFSDGAGGSESGDLHLATLLAAKMEMRFGFGDSLTAISLDDQDLIPTLRTDPTLRAKVDNVLLACLDRATTLIEGHKGAVEKIAVAIQGNSEVQGVLIAEILKQQGSQPGKG